MKWLLPFVLSSQALYAQRREAPLNVVSCPDGQITCDLYPQQWNMANRLKTNPWGLPISQPKDIGIEAVWNQGFHGDRNIIIAVIDSGIDIEHPDLEGNIFTNEREIPGNGIDDDENGFIDDIHGWNFVTNSPDVHDPAGHGTHIAGIIGARGDNDFGVKGVAWQTTLLPVVYLDKDGVGNLKNSLAAVKYAVDMGAKIINASWGGYTKDEIRDLIRWAGEKDVLFITTSGNDGENLDMYPYYPASYHLDNMIVVGSSEFSDGLTGDSNWGKNTVDILAPGISILSTLPNNRYGTMSGTSMSAPHVAAAAALIWSQHPDWSYREVKAALLKTSRLYPSYQNRVLYGRLDMPALFAGEDNQKFFPQAWQTLSLKETLSFTTAGNHSRIFQEEGAKALRVEIPNLRLNSSQRLIIKDKDGVDIQRVTEFEGPFLSDYVYGDSLRLEFILDKDEALRADVSALHFSN